jgi:hypothetical protein
MSRSPADCRLVVQAVVEASVGSWREFIVQRVSLQSVDAYETGRFADVAHQQVAAVRSANDLAAVIAAMRDDLLGTGQQEWENATLESFLEALAAVVEDRRFEGQPSWEDLAQVLVTATGYE